MKVGDTVFQNYGGIHRYGKVTEVKPRFKGDDWSWFKIDWSNDNRFVTAQKWKANMRGEKENYFIPEYYRADDIQRIDLEKVLETLLNLKNG